MVLHPPNRAARGLTRPNLGQGLAGKAFYFRHHHENRGRPTSPLALPGQSAGSADPPFRWAAAFRPQRQSGSAPIPPEGVVRSVRRTAHPRIERQVANANGIVCSSRKRPPRGGNRIPAGPAGRGSDAGARGAEGAVLRVPLPWPRAGPLWSGPRNGPNHAVLPGNGGLECPPDNAGGPCGGRTVVGVGVALRPVGLGCGIRGGYGVVRDPEKGQTRPNQPLHLTGAALRL